MSPISTSKMSNFRWVICALLFIATTVNYMDRQVLSLTWKDFIAPEFHWTDDDYGTITGFFLSSMPSLTSLLVSSWIGWVPRKVILSPFCMVNRCRDACRLRLGSYAGRGLRFYRGTPHGTGW